MKNNILLRPLFMASEMLSAFEADFPGLDREIKAYLKLMIKWSNAEGPLACAKRLKRVRHVCLNAMLNQPNPEYHFMATRGGWPSCVWGLRKFSKTSEGQRIVLTVLDLYRVLIAPGKPDFGSITDPAPVYPEKLMNTISEKAKPLKNSVLFSEYQLRSKSGPNGQSLRTAVLDAIAIKDDLLLDQSLKQVLDVSSIASDLEQVQDVAEWDGPKPIHSKLSTKLEGGGKVRVFAIVDYYTQAALKPLHKAVGKILSKIRQDFTWNQDRIKEQVQIWRDQGVKTFYSIDLKSATDYFPAILQKKVVANLVNPEYAELWYNLMTQRDFYYGRKGPFRYSRGQPMGAYSSWPVFAFSHHLLVREAAKLAKVRSPQYAIVGDDIVIVGQKVAEQYKHLLKQLSIPFSPEKTLTGNCLEFCKRVWNDSQEITPIPSKLLVELLKDYRVITQLSDFLTTRGVPSKLRGRLLQSSLSSLSLDKAKKAWVALMAPWNPLDEETSGQVSGPWLCEETRWPSIPVDVLSDIRQASKLIQLQRATRDLYSVYDQTVTDIEIEGVPGLPAGDFEFSPVHRVHNWIGQQAWDTIDSLDEFLDNFSQNDQIPQIRISDPQVIWPNYRQIKTLEFKILQEVFEASRKWDVEDPDIYDTEIMLWNLFHNKLRNPETATGD